MRMPFVNDDSPHELTVKRSQCAPVLFKPFRAVSDLVADPKNDEKWIEAFVQWEPTRSGFCREIMANMDDYCRAAMQAQNCIANDEPTAGNDADSDSGEHTGTREDIDAILDRAASCEQADPAAAEADAFCRLFDEVELELDGESAGDASTLACTLLVFPNSESSITRNGYCGLLGMAAHSTASTNADLRSRGATLEFSLDELRRFVNETTNDEAEPQRSQRYHNERPTEVIKLIIDVLEGVPEWSPQSLNVQQSAPPIWPYALILEESVRFHRVPRRVLTRRDNGANLSTPSLPSLLPAAVDATQATPLQVGVGAVVVTPENAIRLAINNAFVCETAAMLPTDTYPVGVVANFKGALNGLSHSDTRYVLSLPDSKLGG
ncbi:hypothetical protein PF008_g17744 [Phytophthora fragariae]|uniref:Uncharacterized protein n=1 Tax=Phytophthora fragariae TaxID=53985 RepID=A0A6A3EF43_9STRA|nr:hypothetical protein PF009_g19065 [Phytophthora fragariae]KAE9321775.1 hypothetical protein PF008_g17744 [Phytophthora fragariae]